MKTALVIVDYQMDFINGKLPIPYANTLINRMNKIISEFDIVCLTKNITEKKELVEKDGISFTDTDYYCIDGTDGAKIHEDLEDKYPTFTRNYSEGLTSLIAKDGDTSLLDYLTENEITDVFLCGLTGDYSIKFTTMDLIKNEFNVHLVLDCIKTLGSMTNILKFTKNGVNIITSDDISFFIKAKNSKLGDKLIDPKSKIKKNSKIKSRPWQVTSDIWDDDTIVEQAVADDNTIDAIRLGGWNDSTSGRASRGTRVQVTRTPNPPRES